MGKLGLLAGALLLSGCVIIVDAHPDGDEALETRDCFVLFGQFEINCGHDGDGAEGAEGAGG